MSVKCLNNWKNISGENISHENQNYSKADPENFKTFPNKKNPKGNL